MRPISPGEELQFPTCWLMLALTVSYVSWCLWALLCQYIVSSIVYWSAGVLEYCCCSTATALGFILVALQPQNAKSGTTATSILLFNEIKNCVGVTMLGRKQLTIIAHDREQCQ